MMNVYRDIMPAMGGYLTDKAAIHLPRVELFLQEIGRREPLYFQQRATDEKDSGYADDGYKEHYYKVKFGMAPENAAAEKTKLMTAYLEGLAWVLTYYHNGCGSWTWYYPYLYAPLATDLQNLPSLPLTFDEGTPFTPLLQLLSVLPPQSAPFLPPSYNELMTKVESPLYDYYPKDFSVDANGKKNSWECVVQIPFINEKILVDTISTIDHKQQLSESERQRNIPGLEHRYPAPKPQPIGDKRRRAGQVDLKDSSGWGNALEDDFKQRSSGSGNRPRYSNRK